MKKKLKITFIVLAVVFFALFMVGIHLCRLSDDEHLKNLGIDYIFWGLAFTAFFLIVSRLFNTDMYE